MGEVASTIAEEFQPNGMLRSTAYEAEKPRQDFGVAFAKDPYAL